MPNPFFNPDEAMEALESGVSQAAKNVQKHAGQVVSDATKQVTPTNQDIVNSLYAPSEKSADQSSPSEAGIEQVPQGGSQQHANSNAGPLADQFHLLPGQGEDAHKASMGSLQETLLPGLTDPGKTVSLGDQLTGQGSESNKFGGIDPTKQMTADEQAKYTEAQKELRELQRQHNQTYIRGPLDTSLTVEQEIAKVRQQKEQEEKQKLQEEEEEKKRKEEEEKQQQQQLAEPTTKAKPGNPNIAVGQAKTKTEVHRGAAG